MSVQGLGPGDAWFLTGFLRAARDGLGSPPKTRIQPGTPFLVDPDWDELQHKPGFSFASCNCFVRRFCPHCSPDLQMQLWEGGNAALQPLPACSLSSALCFVQNKDPAAPPDKFLFLQQGAGSRSQLMEAFWKAHFNLCEQPQTFYIHRFLQS